MKIYIGDEIENFYNQGKDKIYQTFQDIFKKQFLREK